MNEKVRIEMKALFGSKKDKEANERVQQLTAGMQGVGKLKKHEVTIVSPTEQGKDEHMNDHHEGGYTQEQAAAYAKEAQEYWNSEAAKANIDKESFRKNFFAAGGGLVLMFGDDGEEGREVNPIWSAMKNTADANNGVIEVATRKFDIKRLEKMGKFYQWYAKKFGLEGGCIDERLKMGTEGYCQIHDKCGACSAVEGAVGFDKGTLAGMAAKHLSANGEFALQPILDDAHLQANHEAVTIYFHTSTEGRVTKADRTELVEKHALPFNVSIPLDAINTYIKEELQLEGDAAETAKAELLDTMVEWNAEIAKVIIMHHNNLQSVAGELTLVVDNTDTQESSAELEQVLKRVSDKQIVWKN